MEVCNGLFSYAEHRKPQHQFDLISIAGEEPDAPPRSFLSWAVFPPEGILSTVKSVDDSSGHNFDDYVAGSGSVISDSHEPVSQEADASTLRSRYSLRTGVRQQHDAPQFFFHDRDETGDYDTDEERRQSRAHRKRKARAHTVQHEDYDEESEGLREAKRPRVQDRLMCTIKLSQDVLQQARTYFQDIDRAEQQRMQVLQSGEYLLRERPRDRDNYQGPTVEPDLRGHPAGRGCTECAALGLICSAINDEFDWLCSVCKQENIECLPVTAPSRKAACSNCINFGAKKTTKWLICSNLYDENQGNCCRQCEKAGESSTCVALPDLSAVHQRVRIDEAGNPFINDRPPTVPVRTSCLQCQATERNCSFDGKADIAESCVGCQMGSRLCQPVTTDKTSWADAGRTQHPRKHSVAGESAEIAAHEPTLSDLKREDDLDNSRAFVPISEIIEIPDSDDETTPAKKAIPIIGRKGTSNANPGALSIMKIFHTKLCHPVVFNHDDFAEPTRTCDFCRLTAYEVIGNEVTKVLGRKLSNGRGWEELRADPVRVDIQNTVVCISCTAHRLNIMKCPQHDMELLDQAANDVENAWKRLKAGYGDKWCSICCSLATHACCNSNAATQNTLSVHGEKGCGMLTCDACTVGLQAWDGDLQKMLASLADIKSEKRPEGLRADWILLKQGDILDNFMKNQ